MFERYTDKARRSIFFARYEASQFGSPAIESDFLLLGIVRESKSLALRWLGMEAPEVRDAIARSTIVTGERISTNVDLPLSPDATRVLADAAEEAERMGHQHIGTEHLFLGLLHEPESFAARALKGRGITIAQVRAGLIEDAIAPPVRREPSPPRGVRVILQLEDGSAVADASWVGRIPGIGESISYATIRGEDSVYRVLDVHWRLHNTDEHAFSAEPSVFQIVAVVLKVRKEAP